MTCDLVRCDWDCLLKSVAVGFCREWWQHPVGGGDIESFGELALENWFFLFN